MYTFENITDSGCDFTAADYASLGLTCVPPSVDFRGTVSDDRNDDTLKDFYDGLRAGDSAKTSAVNPQTWKDTMIPFLEKGRDILVMAFSSGLSATCQSAQIAASELRERYPQRQILVVDTLCASMGQGLLVFSSYWAIDFTVRRNPGLKLSEIVVSEG